MSAAPLPGEVTAPAPVLTRTMITSELSRVLQKDRRSNLVAFFGTGEPQSVEVQARAFEVVPTRSELELRAKLPERVDLDGKGLVFLVDWAEQLPLDIACRLVSRRLRRIGRDTRAAALFGAREVDAKLLGSKLVRVLLGRSALAAKLLKVPGQVVQQGDAYARFLHALVGLPLELFAAREPFVAWCAANDAGPALAALSAEVDGGLVEEVAEVVGREGGPLARAALHAWARAEGEAFFAYLVLLDAAEASSAATYAQAILDDRLSALPYGADLRSARGERTGPALRRLLGTLPDARRWLERAEALIPTERFRADLRASAVLPVGLTARQQAFDEALLALLSAPTPERLRALLAASEAVGQHHLDRDPDPAIRTMSVRLAAYLVEASAAPEAAPPGAPAYQEALELAERYAREGGFVDWARRFLRTTGEGPHLAAHRALVGAVDALRRDQDARFARGYAAWLEHGRPGVGVIPIEDVARRLVADFLRGGPHRRLLVVLMDGMSASDLAQLLESMEGEADLWAPAAWRPSGARLAPGLLPPVLAAAPTLTNVSRAALFAGASKPTHGDEPTAEDRRRWAANRALAGLLPDGEAPRLLLEGELMTDGALSRAASALVAPPEGDGDRVVAVVVNAIDDHLSSGKQVFLRWTVEAIPVLRSLLALAAVAERAVLVVADHGHVPGEVLAPRPAPDRERGGARWRGLRPGERAEPFEVEVPRERAWAPKGCDRVALVWDDRVTYGTAKNGEHGGASLAEVVAPAALVVPASLGDAGGDAELVSVRRHEPAWWSPEPAPAAAEAPVPAPAKRPKKVASSQLALLPPEPAAVAAQAAEPRAARLVKSLRATRLFKAGADRKPPERVEAALNALRILLEHGGPLGLADFARRAQLPPFRATGPLNDLAELLNVDQHTPVGVDHATRQVTVNEELLLQLFEVRP